MLDLRIKANGLNDFIWVPDSDKTPPRQWLQARAVEFIDAHEQEIRAALTERRTG